jgi:iron(III) transport system permease protein
MKRTVLSAVVVLIVVIGLVPILVMLAKSFWVGGHVSLLYYRELVSSGRAWTLLGHSLAVSVPTALLATVVGLPLGVLLSRTDLPFRRTFAIVFTVPLLIPPYITAVSWFDVLGRQGALAETFGPAAAVVSSAWLFGLPGCLLVLFSTFMPIVMLLTMVAARAVDPHLEEAARLVAGWPGVLKGITVPLITPTVMLAGMLVMLLSLGEFSVPAYLRYDVFPVETFAQFSAFYNFGAATAAAIPLALITLLVLAAERFFLRGRTDQLRPAYGGGPQVIGLGPQRWWVCAAVTLLCAVSVVAPFLTLVERSLAPGAYADALTRAGGSLLRSVTYAVVGASAITALGFLTGYLVHTRALRSWRAVDSLTVFLFALPSTVIGIGLIATWNRPSTAFIYATPAIVILGYVAQYTALSSRISVSALATIPSSMEDAAQIVGAGWIRRMACVTVPLARRGIFAGWLAAYIFCLRDTGLTMMVYPPGRETLPVRTFTLMANGSAGLIAALSVLMVVATLCPLALLALSVSRGHRAP